MGCIMKPNDYIKIALAIAGIACLYLVALSNRYEVMDEDGYKVFDKWECCVKWMVSDKNTDEIKYIRIEDIDDSKHNSGRLP